MACRVLLVGDEGLLHGAKTTLLVSVPNRKLAIRHASAPLWRSYAMGRKYIGSKVRTLSLKSHARASLPEDERAVGFETRRKGRRNGSAHVTGGK